MNASFLHPGKARRGATLVEWLVGLMAGALILIMLMSAFSQMVRRGEAREALAHAKSARLAVFAVSAQQQAFGEAYSDSSTQNGFAPGIEEKVLLMCKAPGNVTLLQTEPGGYGVQRMAYSEYDYTVLYSAEEGSWRVFRQEMLIDAAPVPVG